MSLRKKLSNILTLLDKHPEIPTAKIGKSLETSLGKFEEKFNVEIKKLADQKTWEMMLKQFVAAPPDSAKAGISTLSDKEFNGLCGYMKQRPCKATKKLSSRQATESKLFKKIADIRKQTL